MKCCEEKEGDCIILNQSNTATNSHHNNGLSFFIMIKAFTILENLAISFSTIPIYVKGLEKPFVI